MLASTLACTTAADALVNYSLYVPQRPSKVPIAPMGKVLTCACLDSRLQNCERFGQLQYVRAAETFESSHRPDGIFTCFALVLAGRRCLCPEWLGELLIVHHHGQHGSICACSRSKVPIAPMGRILMRLL